MGIGDKVRAAEELKAEQALNEQGKLSGRQIKEVLAKGMALADAMALAQNGVGFEDIVQIADLQAQQREAAAGSSDLAMLTAQHRQDMEKLLERARNRRPESYLGDFPFPNISALNPDGDVYYEPFGNKNAGPKPALQCEIYNGYWDKKAGKAVPADAIEDSQVSKTEARLLNLVKPGEFKVENFEGEIGVVRVVPTINDATGAITKLVIAYPHEWVTKASLGRKRPALMKLLLALVGYDGPQSKLTQWLDEKESLTVAA